LHKPEIRQQQPEIKQQQPEIKQQHHKKCNPSPPVNAPPGEGCK
jgi:hypothetical protein